MSALHDRPSGYYRAGRLLRLHVRLIVSALVGAAITLLVQTLAWTTAVKLLSGWDSGVALYLLLTYHAMRRADVESIRRRAALEDEGAFALLVLTSAAALASLAAVISVLGSPTHGDDPTRWYRLAIGTTTVLLSWAFMHTIFALHYAHEFYGEGADATIGGLAFPGTQEPDYLDFLYYSIVVAMTSQVSDVQITSRTIRRLTAAHGALSFFFNLTILALAVNMVSGLVQGGG